MEGVSVAVSWCAAVSFSTSLMTSAKVLWSFLYILAVMVGASQSPLTNIQSFITFLLYLHKG